MERRGEQWQVRAAEKMAEAPGKHLSRERLRETEKGPAGRVPTQTFRAWAAQEIREQVYKTATGTPMPWSSRAKGARQREWDMAPVNRAVTEKRVGPEAQRAEVEKRVRKWVHDQTVKAAPLSNPTPHLTAPMVHAMVHSLNRDGRTPGQIMAAMAIMAAEGGLTAEWRIEGRGGADRDPWQEVLQAMQGWEMAQETVAQTLQRAKRCIAQFTTGRLTAIDFGMGWAGAKEGISRVMEVYGLDTHRHLLGEEIGYTQPDMRSIFMTYSLPTAPSGEATSTVSVSSRDMSILNVAKSCAPGDSGNICPDCFDVSANSGSTWSGSPAGNTLNFAARATGCT